jgi:hypothetical protein
MKVKKDAVDEVQNELDQRHEWTLLRRMSILSRSCGLLTHYIYRNRTANSRQDATKPPANGEDRRQLWKSLDMSARIHVRCVLTVYGKPHTKDTASRDLASRRRHDGSRVNEQAKIRRNGNMCYARHTFADTARQEATCQSACEDKEGSKKSLEISARSACDTF